MKAISILQPWAALVVAGLKRIETRSWRTPHRGPLLIHAGLRLADARRLFFTSPFREALRRLGYTEIADLATGAIVGAVELLDCVPVGEIESELSEDDRAFGDFRPSNWAWLLAAPRRFDKPLPCVGTLGLFHFDGPTHADAGLPAGIFGETPCSCS